MDTIQKLEQRADDMSAAIREWEAETMAQIGKEIRRIGKQSKSEAEKYDAKKEADKVWKKIFAKLAILTASNIRRLKGIYADAFDDWHTANEYLYDYRGVDFTSAADNESIKSIIDEYVKQNAKDIVNLTQTKALSVVDPYGKVIRLQDAIYKAFGEAVGYVTEGKADFYTSLRRTIENLGGGGCRVDYGAGITRRLDTVVRQNLLYGTKQAHREYNELVGDLLECDGIEIDYHANPRPSHEFMQGKQYSKGEAKTVNGVHYPSAEKSGVYDRLYKDYNCLHYETDIILGVSEPRYSEKELKRLKERDARVFDVGGRQMTGYEASQAMRRIETEVRRQKDIRNMATAAGDNVLVRQCNQRIKAYQGKYDEIANITGIAKEPKRMSVPKPKNLLTSGSTRGNIRTGNVARIPQVPSSTITKKIESGEYSTKLSHQQYQKHVFGTAKYNEYLSQRTIKGGNPQSILTITEEEAQEIITSKAGTGIVKTDKNGNPKPQEDITCDRVIGRYWGGGRYHDTNKVTIHYGKKVAHIVPKKGDNYD